MAELVNNDGFGMDILSALDPTDLRGARAREEEGIKYIWNKELGLFEYIKSWDGKGYCIVVSDPQSSPHKQSLSLDDVLKIYQSKGSIINPMNCRKISREEICKNFNKPILPPGTKTRTNDDRIR